MENENSRTSAQGNADIISVFASSFRQNIEQADDLPTTTENEVQNIFSEKENNPGITEPFIEPMETQNNKRVVFSEPEPAYEPDAEPTARQLRKAAKQEKKDARWEKKQAKRNAKIDRQQRNNTKVMLSGVIFLSIICVLLVLMNHFKLTFMDIPDILSGEKSLSSVTTTMPLALSEPSQSGPSSPPKGDYTVTVAGGVYLRDSASDSASRIAVLDEGTKIAVSAFKYDSENEIFWGRAGINGTYGWVKMSNLTLDGSTDATQAATSPATTIESLG